jgi:hypothetical protein
MSEPILTVDIEKKLAAVSFRQNGDMQAAFDLLLTAIPTRWAERGLLSYRVYPLDDAYGDPLADGLMTVAWGAP